MSGNDMSAVLLIREGFMKAIKAINKVSDKSIKCLVQNLEIINLIYPVIR